MAGRRKVRLRTIGNVRTELARVYRVADAGEMLWADACRAVYVLRELRQILETTDLEQRVAEIEVRLEIASAARPNGSAMRHAAPAR